MFPIQLMFLLLALQSTQHQREIMLKTAAGQRIKISAAGIYFNHTKVYGDPGDIVYASHYNRLVEQDGNSLLFLEMDGRPNFNTLAVFQLSSRKASKLAEVVYNDQQQGSGPAPFTDPDKDGKIEFGGFDLNESHPSKDSACYNPCRYYEIDRGRIRFDSVLTKKMAIAVNGVYIVNPLDKDGNCCIVIKRQRPVR